MNELQQQKPDLHTPDESRPPKRACLEAPLSVTQDVQQELIDGADDDWDDVYGGGDSGGSLILGLQAPDAPRPPEHQFGAMEQQSESSKADEVMDGVPAEAIERDDHLVAPQTQPSTENQVKEETTQVEYQPQPMLEFKAVSLAQKDDANAEWQYDSSASSSGSDSDDDSSSDDDDSDSGSADGYELMDPATVAKILMSGEGDDDDGDKSSRKTTVEFKPRTQNEKEETVEKPDVELGPGDEITLLGTVENIVENMILVKGSISGEYQVLEPGSALCNDKREVVGAVADTMGRTQEPMYIVAFNDRQEIENAGLLQGNPVFYINKASTFVFTAPLKTMKGTDASNIHDEEIGEDEAEFSDDEEEAEYKRLKKAAKKSGRGGLSRSDFQNRQRPSEAQSRGSGRQFHSMSDAPAHSYGGGMSYDDEPGEEFYQPLKRPDNLAHLMGPGSLPPRPPRSSFDRGGGRGRGDRGRGRSDRGRGRGGFDQRRGRGGREAKGTQRPDPSHNSSSQNFPDRHGSYEHVGAQQSAPTGAHPAQPFATPNLEPHQPQTYQFNGQTYQYGYPPAPAATTYNTYNQQQGLQNPVGQFPVGAYVNPAVYQPPTQQSYGQYGQSYPQAYGSVQGASQQQQQSPTQVPPPNIDISSILSRLGASHPPSK